MLDFSRWLSNWLAKWNFINGMVKASLSNWEPTFWLSYIYRKSSVKTNQLQNISSNNTSHIFFLNKFSLLLDILSINWSQSLLLEAVIGWITTHTKWALFSRIWKFKIWKNNNIARNYSKSKNEDFEKLKIVKKFWKIKSF